MIQINRRITNVEAGICIPVPKRSSSADPETDSGLSGATGGLDFDALLQAVEQYCALGAADPSSWKDGPNAPPKPSSGLLERLWLVLDSLPERKASQGSLRRHSL